MRKILYLFLLFLIIPNLSFATVYYVDYTNGNDSNNGLTLALPFKTMAPVTGTNFLLPGDHVEILGNNTFVGNDCNFTINSNGILSNPIVVERFQGNAIANPIFDCATPATSLSGWAGWTFSTNTYRFIVTSASATAGAVYSNNGNNYTVLSTITSSTALNTSGTSSPTSSGTLTKVSGTGDATITFSSETVISSIWSSNIVIPFTVEGVIVDGTYNVLYGQAPDLFVFPNRYNQPSGSGNIINVNLKDFTDPDSHTIEFVGQYNAAGSIITTNGNYLTFNNLETYGSSNSGWFTPNIGIKINNSSGWFSGYASLYCATYFQPVGCYNSTFDNFTAEYSNGSASRGGNGENVVVEGSYDDFKNGLIENGAMAGYDVISFAPPNNPPTETTPGSFDRLINTTSRFNSLRSIGGGGTTDPTGFDPAAVYCDGCNNFQAIGNTLIGDAPFGGASTNNLVNTVSISSEHPTTNIPHDVYFYNNIMASGNGATIQASESGSSGQSNIYNVWLIGNTVYGTATSGVGGNTGFSHFDTSKGVSIHLRNNIFYNVGNSAIGAINFAQPTLVDSDYNDFYSTSSTNVIVANGSNSTLANWQSTYSQDSHSINADPRFVSPAYPTYDMHLQRTSLGQANTSPAIGIGLSGYFNQFFNIYNLGTTASNGVIDSSILPDLGYHYNYKFGSSLNWNRGFTEQYN